MTTKTISECMVEIRENFNRNKAESIDTSETQTIADAIVDETVIRQGDVYLVCVESITPGTATNNRQLAPGTSQGSRHILEGNVTIVQPSEFRYSDKLYNRLRNLGYKGEQSVPRELIGPSFRAESSTVDTHPEHGNFVLPEGSTWQCIYQQSWAEEVRRVQD